MEGSKSERNRKNLAKVIARCWGDENFKKKFISNPQEVLQAEGVAIPKGVSARVLEDDAATMTIVIPPALSDVSGIAEMEERIAALLPF